MTYRLIKRKTHAPCNSEICVICSPTFEGRIKVNNVKYDTIKITL